MVLKLLLILSVRDLRMRKKQKMESTVQTSKKVENQSILFSIFYSIMVLHKGA